MKSAPGSPGPAAPGHVSLAAPQRRVPSGPFPPLLPDPLRVPLLPAHPGVNPRVSPVLPAQPPAARAGCAENCLFSWTNYWEPRLEPPGARQWLCLRPRFPAGGTGEPSLLTSGESRSCSLTERPAAGCSGFPGMVNNLANRPAARGHLEGKKEMRKGFVRNKLHHFNLISACDRARGRAGRGQYWLESGC